MDRRIVLSSHLGLDLDSIHGALLARSDRDVDLVPGFSVVLGKPEHELQPRAGYTLRAITAGAATVVPYLVSPLAVSANRGSQGFAAALRSAFQAGPRQPADTRVLITLDPAPVETVLTASEGADSLPELTWTELANRARVSIRPGPASGLLDAVVSDIAQRRGSATLLDQLLAFVSDDWASEEAAGRALHRLGAHLSDPHVAGDWAARLSRGARWRERITAWAAPGSDLDHALATQPTISEAVAAKISSSLGPHGPDFASFTLSEVEGTAPAPGLEIASPLHITIAPAVSTVVAGEPVAAIWLPGGSGTFRVRLAGTADGTETAAVSWQAGAARAEITGRELAITIAGSGWAAGSAELHSAAGRSRLSFLAYFGSGSWFPVERRLDIDTAAAAFVVAGGEPEILAVGAAGQFLGPATVTLPGQATGMITATATSFGEDATVPLLLAGEPGDGDDGDDGGGTGDDGDDDGDDIDDGGDGGGAKTRPAQPSPVHARIDAARESESPDVGAVTFTAATPILVGGWAYELAGQLVRSHDGLDLERQVLASPAATAFALSTTGVIEQLDDLTLRDAGPLAPQARAFLDARASFFAVAATRGTVLALGADLPRTEALAYCETYGDLLAAVPRGERYRPEYDSILLADTITYTPTGEIFIAPTHPQTVAFYLAFAEAAEGWVTSQQLPSRGDSAAITPRHLLPMFNLDGRWFDSAPSPAFLWRAYRPMYQPGSLSEHDPRLISNRLRFFLDVYPAYNDPRQRIAVAFHDPGDGTTVLQALRAFYRPDITHARTMRGGPALTRPVLDVSIVGDGEIPRAIRTLLDGISDDLADRVLRERVRFRVTEAGSPDAGGFHHVTFLFRSRGERTPWPVDMGERAPTSYVGGLATAPGRAMLSGGGESAFAWGAFAPAACGDSGAGRPGSVLASVTRGLLELVGGQPRELVQDGLTRMPTTVVHSGDGAAIYDSSVWIVHLDRLLGLEAFTPAAAHPLYIVDYSESDDPGDPGLDAITVTGKVTPYHHALSVALADFGTLTPAGRDGILQVLNGVSGRWALQLLRQAPHQVRERVGTVTAIAVLRDLERCFEICPGAGVIVPLEEVWDAVERRAAAAGQHPSCDDLVYLHLARDDLASVTVTARLVEVKFRSAGQPSAAEARAELETGTSRLRALFDTSGPARLFRGRDLAEVIRAGWTRGRAFGLHTGGDAAWFESALADIAAGRFRLELQYTVGSEPVCGDVISVEAQSTAEPARVMLPGVGSAFGMIRVGRTALDSIAAGRSIARPRGWEPATFGGGGTGGSTGGPPAAGGPAPGAAPAGAAGHADPAGDATAGGGRDAGSAAAGVPEPPPRRTGHGDEEAERLAGELTRAAAKYGLDLEPFQPHLAQVGPSVIRFRTRPLGRQALAGVQRLALDLGREIGAGGGVLVDQEAYFITVDVPRAQRETVPYADYEHLLDRATAPGSLDFLVGMAPSGDVRIADLARLPHLLVAGATGSGKSVFLRALLASLVRTRTPEQLRLMVVDPKQVDFLQFEDLPHLMLGGVLTDPAEALIALVDTIDHERQHRLPILRGAGVTNVIEYYEAGHAPEELPQIVVVVDEFADLATSLDRENRARFMGLIQRYGQITRAFGIYLVLATQRPSVNVITGDIKANLTARVALKVQAPQDSVTILGRGGAERLRDRGDLIFDHGGNAERLQGFLATAEDARRAIGRWLNPGR
ncbi:MAG TPA: FtsK/SpoIIIE domain-containing protein [Egibacteraceae bacterium]|nr:FtsK/SpoIIIE domain-containing protein [Egibacteraceae bacterium]